MNRQTILMCPPDHFGVDYVINPWMQNNQGQTDLLLAQRQWKVLRNRMACFADILQMNAAPGLPDMVFTANAGLVLGDKAVVSRFTSPERRGEEPFFRDWFKAHDFKVVEWPEDVFFEGAGDSLFDRGQNLLWQGTGFRSDPRAVPLLQQALGCRVIGLQLVDPRFYHLDTCFCPLGRGFLMYFPEAFSPESRALIEAEVPIQKRIPVGLQDALNFACNAVDLEGNIFLNAASTDLRDMLCMAGLAVNLVPMSEFMKAGGGVKCLTLKLIEPS